MKGYDFRVAESVRCIWEIDAHNLSATTGEFPGMRLALRPFMGVMGNAPAAPGPHSTTPPRAVGGNLDCAELVAGSTLFLPVEVDGALFSVGDGHAVQADGEVGQTAIECPMREVELTLTARPDLHLEAPEASTPAGYVTMGFGDTLDEATDVALNHMLDYLCRTYSIGRTQALALSSLVVHMRITQIVNTVVGVHALLPQGVLGTWPQRGADSNS
jgi:acetamidase/formamidase